MLLRAEPAGSDDQPDDVATRQAMGPAVNAVRAGRPSVARVMPLYTEGMRIGLLGGSFNPPHVAHRAISLFAIKRLKLDRVWWLISPGNPLKDNGALHDLRERAEAARQVADDPRIDVTCLES